MKWQQAAVGGLSAEPHSRGASRFQPTLRIATAKRNTLCWNKADLLDWLDRQVPPASQ